MWKRWIMMTGSSADTYFQDMVLCFHSSYTKWHWGVCSVLLKDVQRAAKIPPLRKEAIRGSWHYNMNHISHSSLKKSCLRY